MLSTLRSVIGDDTEWFADIHDFYQHFKYQTIMTEDVIAWWNQHTGLDLTPFFNEYLTQAAIPTLELIYDPAAKAFSYRWRAEESAFAMPIRVGDPEHWTVITPSTTSNKTLAWPGSPDTFKVATDLYYVNVHRTGVQP